MELRASFTGRKIDWKRKVTGNLKPTLTYEKQHSGASIGDKENVGFGHS